MIKVGEQGNEAKLLEDKRNEMNSLIGLNNIAIKDKVKLLINGWCKEHIKTLHKEYPSTERLAICKVVPKGNGIFEMVDMLFPWQKGVGWEVETTTEGMEWLTKELINRKEKLAERNCVLHSHHHMGCFWSQTDDNARLNLNDWRQLAWAVVTAYNKEWENFTVEYKGCLNFYKPYNIEIDVAVEDKDDISIVDKYNEYLEKVNESEWKYYDLLMEENKQHIEDITNTPSYLWILEYLGLDITNELIENYDNLKEKIWNPELLEYLKELKKTAKELALTEINSGWKYNDMLVEYWEYCSWSNGLLQQLAEHRKTNIIINNSWLFSSLTSETTYPVNRDFEDEYYSDYYFNSYDFDEYYTRQTLGIGVDVPMKVGVNWEWLAWSNDSWRYMYVEDRANEIWQVYD